MGNAGAWRRPVHLLDRVSVKLVCAILALGCGTLAAGAVLEGRSKHPPLSKAIRFLEGRRPFYPGWLIRVAPVYSSLMRDLVEVSSPDEAVSRIRRTLLADWTDANP